MHQLAAKIGSGAGYATGGSAITSSGARFQGRYIVDFYCPQLRLAIEIDGRHHETSWMSEYDSERSAGLSARGIEIVRIPNELLIRDAVLTEECIHATILPRAALRNSPSPGLRPPSPRDAGASALPRTSPFSPRRRGERPPAHGSLLPLRGARALRRTTPFSPRHGEKVPRSGGCGGFTTRPALPDKRRRRLAARVQARTSVLRAGRRLPPTSVCAAASPYRCRRPA